MTAGEIREEILDILEAIAPDEDLSNIDDAVNFRDQLELDSMDFLGHCDGTSQNAIAFKFPKTTTCNWPA